MKPNRTICYLAALAFAGTSGCLYADVKMPMIFGDHMVLQEDAKLPVWGKADAGESVTVTVGSESAKATADADGKWRVDLEPLPKGTSPVTMTVTGKNSLKFDDVVIGDVWVCSGQSNMEFGITSGGMHNFTAEIPKADNPMIRLYYVPKKVFVTPQDDFAAPENPLMGHWQLCTPDNLAKDGGWNGFSSVGYFFGREIQKTTGNPVGLISDSWSGTPAQAWVSLTGLQKEPAFKNYLDTYATNQNDFAKTSADFPAKRAAYQVAIDQWNQEVGPVYKPALDAWKDAVAKAKAAGQPLPPPPQPSKPAPVPPHISDGGANGPTNLYNGLIAPLIPYAIKGVIWYQGESNAANVAMALEYGTLFPRLISDWREKWGEGDFPFLYVQLSKYKDPDPAFSVLRESQLKTLSLPNTGMAVAFDIGDQTSIHPADKLDVGLRLAEAAKHVAYGQNNVYSGPRYDKIDVTGNTIRVSFTQTGGGMIIGTAPCPWTPPVPPALSTTSLVGFMIAGADKKWFSADAKIDGDAVVVSSPQVAQPVAVRYAFNLADGNLYNKEGLPASPFRSDDWDDAPPLPTQVPPAHPLVSPIQAPTAPVVK